MSKKKKSTKMAVGSIYEGRKPAKQNWPVGCGRTLKKLPKFPDYEQPFALTDEQIRELMSHPSEEQHEDSRHSYEEEVGSNNLV
jgi:hypothetical protein